MTLKELKQTIDNYLGLTSLIEPSYSSNSAKLVYLSPTGIKLFDLTVGDYDNNDNWEFGGNSGALPESWKPLCHIHEQLLA